MGQGIAHVARVQLQKRVQVQVFDFGAVNELVAPSNRLTNRLGERIECANALHVPCVQNMLNACCRCMNW